MPTYVYKFVETGETIEVQQGFHDDNLTEIAHPDSGEVLPVKKVFTPVGVTFKGSGFFKTDNRGKKSATTPASASTTSDSEEHHLVELRQRLVVERELVDSHEVRQFRLIGFELVQLRFVIGLEFVVEQLTIALRRR